MQILSNNLIPGQKLSHELFNEYVQNENFVTDALLFAVAHRNLKNTPSDWSLIPRLQTQLSVTPKHPAITPVRELFFQDMVETLESTSNFAESERIVLLLQFMVAWGPDFNTPCATKSLVQPLIEKYTSSPISNHPNIEILLYAALVYGRITINECTPLVIQTIRKGTAGHALECEMLLRLSAEKPALQAAVAEALILSNAFSPIGMKLIDNNPNCLNMIKTYLDNPFDNMPDINAQETLAWRRCLCAILLTDPEFSSAFNDFILSKHVMLRTTEYGTLKHQELENIKQTCNIYAELYGPFTRDTISIAIDDLLQQYVRHDVIESPAIFESNLLSGPVAM